MQIKRFEAPDMTTALSRVKQAFGPEAVILSVRNLKKEGGLLGFWSRSGVEVTAAIDPVKIAEGQPPVESPADPGYGAVWPAPGAAALSAPARTPQAAAGSGAGGWMRELRRTLGSHGVRDHLVQELVRRLPAPAPGAAQDPAKGLVPALADLLEAKGISAPVTPGAPSAPRVIALVGATGVGKTSAAARITIQYFEALKGRIGLISCDDRKVASEAEIVRYGRIIGVPVACAWTPAAMREAMGRMADRSLVIIDTPGLSQGDGQSLQALQEMLQVAGAQIHLLLNAAAKPADLERTVDRFSALDIERLTFTRLDETGEFGALVNLPAARRIPLAWVAFGPEIPEALRPADGTNVARLILASAQTIEDWRSHTVWMVEAPGRAPAAPAAGTPTQKPAPAAPAQFVANRHSRIFHRSECKAAKKIKAENKVAFASCEAAAARQFEPCRACLGQEPRPATEARSAAERRVHSR